MQGKTFVATARKYSIPESAIRARYEEQYADKNSGPSKIDFDIKRILYTKKTE